jgi:hypothetical protein
MSTRNEVLWLHPGQGENGLRLPQDRLGWNQSEGRCGRRRRESQSFRSACLFPGVVRLHQKHRDDYQARRWRRRQNPGSASCRRRAARNNHHARSGRQAARPRRGISRPDWPVGRCASDSRARFRQCGPSSRCRPAPPRCPSGVPRLHRCPGQAAMRRSSFDADGQLHAFTDAVAGDVIGRAYDTRPRMNFPRFLSFLCQ